MHSPHPGLSFSKYYFASWTCEIKTCLEKHENRMLSQSTGENLALMMLINYAINSMALPVCCMYHSSWFIDFMQGLLHRASFHPCIEHLYSPWAHSKLCFLEHFPHFGGSLLLNKWNQLQLFIREMPFQALWQQRLSLWSKILYRHEAHTSVHVLLHVTVLYLCMNLFHIIPFLSSLQIVFSWWFHLFCWFAFF